ncbi:MAG: secondary thiamine-phosphate synthase enzyme YjbQ [Candidatus Cyclobacteriaceae bacterium M2_1C_046]
MRTIQKEITLPAYNRGFHLITNRIIDDLSEIGLFSAGLLHIFITHTSASLTINENADPSVRRDFEKFFSRTVPDGAEYFEHTMEGPDDMPAHIKSALLGPSLTIPITKGKLNLGTWQGIYLCEHRNSGGERSLVLTITGD